MPIKQLSNRRFVKEINKKQTLPVKTKQLLKAVQTEGLMKELSQSKTPQFKPELLLKLSTHRL